MVGHMDNNQNQLHMFTYKFKMTQRHSDPVQVKTSAESNSPGPRGCHKVLASLYMGVFPYCAGPMFALFPKKKKKPAIYLVRLCPRGQYLSEASSQRCSAPQAMHVDTMLRRLSSQAGHNWIDNRAGERAVPTRQGEQQQQWEKEIKEKNAGFFQGFMHG